MEWILSPNNESWLLTVVISFAALLSGFGSLLMLQPSQGRKLLLALLIMLGITEVFLVGWGIHLRLAKSAAGEKNKAPKPRPTPAPKPSPKELEVKPELSEEQAMAGGITFNMSSRSDATIRKQFCIDSDLSGRFYNYAGRLMVKLETAGFDLCKYSSDDERQIEYRVGIGQSGDIARKNWRAISWSPVQKGVVTSSGSELAPEKSFVIPMKRLGKNKAATDLTSYGVVVSVYNRDRRGLYYLSNEN